MEFAYYTKLAVGLAADLANTLHPVTGEDSLGDEGDLGRFLAAHEEAISLAAEEALEDTEERASVGAAYGEAIAGWDIDAKDVAAVRALRAPLQTVFEWAASDERGTAALLNEQLRLSGATPRISWRHGPLHLHFESQEEGCAGWLAATTLMGLAVVLCDHGGDRLGVCASPSCQRVFVDLSKNSSKIYCSQACANRESVTAFRARKRAGS